MNNKYAEKTFMKGTYPVGLVSCFATGLIEPGT